MSSYRISTLLTLGLAALLFGGVARSAEPPGRIGFRSYGTDAGIENHDMSWVLQDAEGFVWVCAADAVYRFEGERFERFGLDAGLPSSIVRDATLDAGGRLLLATHGGVVRWDGSRFAAVPMYGVPAEVWSIGVDAEGRMLAGTEQGLYVESEPGRLVPLPGWPGGPALVLRVEPMGALQVGSGSRVWSRDVRGRWLVHEVPGRSNAITSLARDGQGRLWVSAEGWLAVQPREGAPFEAQQPTELPARDSSRFGVLRGFKTGAEHALCPSVRTRAASPVCCPATARQRAGSAVGEACVTPGSGGSSASHEPPRAPAPRARHARGTPPGAGRSSTRKRFVPVPGDATVAADRSRRAGRGDH